MLETTLRDLLGPQSVQTTKKGLRWVVLPGNLKQLALEAAQALDHPTFGAQAPRSTALVGDVLHCRHRTLRTSTTRTRSLFTLKDPSGVGSGLNDQVHQLKPLLVDVALVDLALLEETPKLLAPDRLTGTVRLVTHRGGSKLGSGRRSKVACQVV